MKNKRVLIAVVILFILFILGVFLSFKSEIDRQSQILLKGYAITLESQVKGKSLSWKDEDLLEEIIEELAIFSGEIMDYKTYQKHKINTLKIIYVSERQTSLPFSTSNNEIISAGSYSISNNTLEIKIYVDENLAPDNNIVSAFNLQLVQFLIIMSTVPKNINPSAPTTVEDRLVYFNTVVERHLKDNKYPIEIL